MEITNPNYNTMPEQVNQNTKDITVLKNTVKTPAIIYNATVEMAQDAGVINQSNITQQVTNTANAFVLDTVGKLFRIVTVENDQVYVAYCASIRGPQGENGTNGQNGIGIQSITEGTPTQENDYTVTPVVFVKTNGDMDTLNIRAKNGNTPNASPFVQVNTNDNVYNSGKIEISRFCNLVILNFDNVTFKEQQGNDLVVATGLPYPNSQLYGVITSIDQSSTNTILRFSIKTTGELVLWYDAPDNSQTQYYGQLIYISND